MQGRKGCEICLLICLSIFLIVAVISETTIVIFLTAAKDKFTESERTILVAMCVGVAIEIVAEIVGIVAILFKHYYGCLAFTVYQYVGFISVHIIMLVIVIKGLPFKLVGEASAIYFLSVLFKALMASFGRSMLDLVQEIRRDQTNSQ